MSNCTGTGEHEYLPDTVPPPAWETCTHCGDRREISNGDNKEPHHKVQLYAIRHKETRKYFRFNQYAEDGWGMHEATVSCSYVATDGEFPSFFSAREYQKFISTRTLPVYALKRPNVPFDRDGCKFDEVEFVPFMLAW